MRKIICTYLFLFVAVNATSQSCIDKLVGAYKVMAEKCNMDKHKTFHTEYSIAQEDWIGNKTYQNFNLYTDGNKSYLLSENYSVCADSILTVTIRHDQKIIYIGVTVDQETKNQALNRLIAGSHENFSIFDESSCSVQQVKDEEQINLELVTKAEFATAYKMNKTLFEFNESTVDKISIMFSRQNDLKEMVYEIKTMETDLEYDVLKMNPSDFILTFDGKLQAKYEGYSIEHIEGEDESPLKITKS